MISPFSHVENNLYRISLKVVRESWLEENHSLTDEVDTTSLFPPVEAVIHICQLSLVTLLSHPMMPGDWSALSLHAQTSAFWHKSCIYTRIRTAAVLGNYWETVCKHKRWHVITTLGDI